MVPRSLIENPWKFSTLAMVFVVLYQAAKLEVYDKSTRSYIYCSATDVLYEATLASAPHPWRDRTYFPDRVEIVTSLESSTRFDWELEYHEQTQQFLRAMVEDIREKSPLNVTSARLAAMSHPRDRDKAFKFDSRYALFVPDSAETPQELIPTWVSKTLADDDHWFENDLVSGTLVIAVWCGIDKPRQIRVRRNCVWISGLTSNGLHALLAGLIPIQLEK